MLRLCLKEERIGLRHTLLCDFSFFPACVQAVVSAGRKSIGISRGLEDDNEQFFSPCNKTAPKTSNSILASHYKL